MEIQKRVAEENRKALQSVELLRGILRQSPLPKKINWEEQGDCH